MSVNLDASVNLNANQSTVEEAEERRARIQNGLALLDTLIADITDAYQRRDWKALGYDAWEGYAEENLVSAQLRVPRERRRELVGSLREAGMSTRAIASATGVDDKTVRNDMKTGAENSAPAEDTPVAGLDGKSYSPSKPTITDLISGDDVAELNGQPRDEDEPIDAEVLDEQPSSDAAPAVTPEPTRKKPRKPITEQARKEALDGLKWADRLRNLMRDDRCRRNSEQLCDMLRGDLMHVRDAVNEALETLADHVPNSSS